MRAVNLIPQDQRGAVSAAGRSGGGAYAVLGVLGGLALLALLYGIAAHEISSDKSKAAELTAKAARAEAATNQLTPYTSFIGVREARMQAVSSLMGTRFDWAHSLHEFGRVLPKDASVSSITATVGSSTASADHRNVVVGGLGDSRGHRPDVHDQRLRDEPGRGSTRAPAPAADGWGQRSQARELGQDELGG